MNKNTMNKSVVNNTLLGMVALSLVVLFLGSMVSAVSVDASAMTKTKIDNIVKMDRPQALLVKDFAETRGELVSKVKQSLAVSSSAEKKSAVDLSNDMLVPGKSLSAAKGLFVSAAAKVKAAIVKDEKSNEGNSTFKGWTINRIVNASGLTAEQKKSILASYQQNDALKQNWQRYHILMWNTDAKFMAIGKLSGIRSNGTMSAYVRGFNSLEDSRFYLYAGNGLLAGVQNGKVFWGTYANGVGVMNFQDQTAMKFQYVVYQN